MGRINSGFWILSCDFKFEIHLLVAKCNSHGFVPKNGEFDDNVLVLWDIDLSSQSAYFADPFEHVA